MTEKSIYNFITCMVYSMHCFGPHDRSNYRLQSCFRNGHLFAFLAFSFNDLIHYLKSSSIFSIKFYKLPDKGVLDLSWAVAAATDDDDY